MNAEIFSDPPGSDRLYYRWIVMHGNQTGAVVIEKSVFDRMPVETRKKVLKAQLVSTYTKLISNLINIE